MATVGYEKELLDLSLPAAADYSTKQFYLMVQNSSGQAELANSAGEKCIGVLQDDPDTAGDQCRVRVQGVSKVVAGGTFSYDAALTTDASGKAIVAADENDYVVGRALSSAVASDIVPMMLPANIVRGLPAIGTVEIPMGSYVEQDGTALADFADGASNTPGYSHGDESAGIRWNNAAAPDPISSSFVIPADADTGSDMTLNILAAKVGATIGDAVTWKVELFGNVNGALYDADADFGGTSSAMTGDAATKTCQLETLTLANANIPAAGSVVVITIQPTDGTLGTDDVILLGTSIAYTRK
jgi:hypothetical protein